MVDYKDKGVSIAREYYASILERLKEAIKEKRRGKLAKGVLLLHEKAPVHKSRVALAVLHKVGFDILNHPPYSPDLAPSDNYLFPKLKKELRDKKKITPVMKSRRQFRRILKTKRNHFFMKQIN